jgi:hypothetical protein
VPKNTQEPPISGLVIRHQQFLLSGDAAKPGVSPLYAPLLAVEQNDCPDIA